MNYPQNEEEAKKAIEFYDDFHSNNVLPDLTINIERDIDINGDTSICDIEFHKTLENCHDAHVFIKKLFFATGEMDVSCPPLDFVRIDLKDFIAAAAAIKAYASIIEKKGGEE